MRRERAGCKAGFAVGFVLHSRENSGIPGPGGKDLTPGPGEWPGGGGANLWGDPGGKTWGESSFISACLGGSLVGRTHFVALKVPGGIPRRSNSPYFVSYHSSPWWKLSSKSACLGGGSLVGRTHFVSYHSSPWWKLFIEKCLGGGSLVGSVGCPYFVWFPADEGRGPLASIDLQHRSGSPRGRIVLWLYSTITNSVSHQFSLSAFRFCSSDIIHNIQ